MNKLAMPKVDRKLASKKIEIVKNLKIGFDPTLFTEKQLKVYFNNTSILKPISKNLIDEIYKKKITVSKPFFSLNQKIRL